MRTLYASKELLSGYLKDRIVQKIHNINFLERARCGISSRVFFFFFFFVKERTRMYYVRAGSEESDVSKEKEEEEEEE